MDAATTYQLVHPIVQKRRIQGSAETIEDVTSEVQLRRINGSDIRWLEAMEGKPGKTLGLLSRLTGLDARVIDLLDAEDIAGLSETIADFLPDSLKVGASSSGT